MLLKRFYDEQLAQASYLIGCTATGEALVVDPNRAVEEYLRAASSEGLRVTHITETHIHADFVSGTRELAARSGGRVFLSDEGSADWKYQFAATDGATLVKDEDQFKVGNVRIEVMRTPGHTPEHISFLVTDTAASHDPIGVLTGDFVFVGDVGRPDLLERAAGIAGSMHDAARVLYASVQRFKQLPDHLQVWPGHGAGSACGKALGQIPSSTVGYERRTNWALRDMSENEFVAEVLAGQPEPPRYFAEMKRMNKIGPAILGTSIPAPRVSVSGLSAALAAGAAVIDTRPAAEFAGGFIPGTINIPLNKSFTTWAGWLIPYDRDIVLIVRETEPARAAEITRELAMIGLDRVREFATSDVVARWPSHGALDRIPEIGAADLAAALRTGRVQLVDVRGAAEWAEGHIPTAKHIPLGYLAGHIAALPRDRPTVVQCQSGARSSIAASLLRASGLDNVINLAGGIQAWRAAGLQVESSPSPS